MTQFSPAATCAHGRRMDLPCEACRVQIRLDPSLPVVSLTVEEINLNAGRIWSFNPKTAQMGQEAAEFYGIDVTVRPSVMEKPALLCPYCDCIFAVQTPLGSKVWCPGCGEVFHLQDTSTALPRGG